MVAVPCWLHHGPAWTFLGAAVGKAGEEVLKAGESDGALGIRGYVRLA